MQKNKLKESPEKNKKEITGKKHDIHIYLYKFRFLNTHHIQKLLNHKSKTYVNDWLIDLTNKKYIKRYYSGKMRLNGLPAIYYLGLKGRKYLKDLRDEGHKEFKLSQLDRVYKEEGNSLAFKIKWLSLVDAYLSLIKLTSTTGAKLTFYTQVDLKGMKDLIDPAPDAYFVIEEKNKMVTRYFLEYAAIYISKEEMEEKVKNYISYFKSNNWQNNTGHSFPKIILIIPKKSSQTSLNKFIKEQLNEKSVDMDFYLSNRQEIKQYGVNKQTLHEVKLK